MTKAPAMDLAALAAAAKESDPIERSRNAESKFANNPFLDLVKNSAGRTMELPKVANTEAAKEVQSYLRNASDRLGLGLSTTMVASGNGFVVKFATKPKRATGGMATCPVCEDEVTVTQDGKIRIHGPRDARCAGSGRNANGETETPAAETPSE